MGSVRLMSLEEQGMQQVGKQNWMDGGFSLP